MKSRLCCNQRIQTVLSAILFLLLYTYITVSATLYYETTKLGIGNNNGTAMENSRSSRFGGHGDGDDDLLQNLTNKGITIEIAKKLRAKRQDTLERYKAKYLPLAGPDINTTHPRMAFLTFTHLNGTNRFEDLIFPSLDTWHSHNNGIPFFVILSNVWTDTYEDLVREDPSFTNYRDRIHPVWVDCPEGKTIVAESCKQEQGLLYMLDRGYDQHFDWIIYLDDDTFLRTTYLRQFLKQLPTDELFLLTGGSKPMRLGRAGYMPAKSPYSCSKDPEYRYPWGQVVAYNPATLRHIETGLRLQGLSKQCTEFDVLHDVGNAIFHWMYQLPELDLVISDRAGGLRREHRGVHGVGRCKNFPCFMDELEYGMGQYWYIPKAKDYQLHWRNVTGFRSTMSYRKYGDPSSWRKVWHTMPTLDC